MANIGAGPVGSFAELRLIRAPGGGGAPLPPPDTLQDCPGCLAALPLRPPNADARRPATVVDMVNVLAVGSHMQDLFDQEVRDQEERERLRQQRRRRTAAAEGDAREQDREASPYTPAVVDRPDYIDPSLSVPEASSWPTHAPSDVPPLPAVYDYDASDIMREALRAAARVRRHVPGLPAAGGGHLVQPGAVSFYTCGGATYAAGPGRWLLRSVRAKWIARNIPLDQDVIAAGAALIVQVPPGAVGRVWRHGAADPVLLAPGAHVFNGGEARSGGAVLPPAGAAPAVSQMDSDGSGSGSLAHWSHGPYHVVRVRPGQLAKVWVEVAGASGPQLQPRLLRAGEHRIVSHTFRCDGLVPADSPFVEHGPLRRVLVPRGDVARVWEDGAPRLLGEGCHALLVASFRYDGLEDLAQLDHLVHGTITILRIPLGRVALAWRDAEPIFLTEPGLHEFDSTDFRFVEMRDLSEPIIQLGSKTMLMVRAGHVAVTYNHGELEILPQGHHVLHGAHQVFQRFLSLQQKSVRLGNHRSAPEVNKTPKKGGILKSVAFPEKLESCSYEEMKRREAEAEAAAAINPQNRDTVSTQTNTDEGKVIVVSETKDLIRVGMQADVLFSIADATKLVTATDPDKLEGVIHDRSISVLTSIIRSTPLIRMTKGTLGTLPEEPPRIEFPDSFHAGNDSSSGGADFFADVQQNFAAQLQEGFLDEYGVRLAALQITSFKIMDGELAEQIAKQALTAAQLQSKISQLDIKSQVYMAEERAASEAKQAAAVADRNAQKYRADAKNQRDIEAARTKAEVQKITQLTNAEVEAQAMIIRAKAEAEALRIRTLAEAERAELLSRTTLGRQLALMDRYAEMVIESRRGMQAIMFDPAFHDKSPFGSLSPAIVSSELRSLEQMAPPRRNGGRSVPASTALTTCTTTTEITERESRRSESRSLSSSSGSIRRSRSATSRRQHDQASSADSGSHRNGRRSHSSGR